jgi:hypothetical protein
MALPTEIGLLQGLVELDVTNAGALVKIPETICTIHNLETLYVDATVTIPYCLASRISSRFRIVVK